MVQIEAVQLQIPQESNIILGQSHFIKTVEDLYEALINSAPQIRFGVAFNEASGPRLIRSDGNDEELRSAAVQICRDTGAGHFFAIVLRGAFPINVLKAVQQVPEIVSILCATANPVQALVAVTGQGRGVIGVVDGSSPLGIENAEQSTERHGFLRRIGYKR